MRTAHVVYVRNCRNIVNMNKNVAVMKLAAKLCNPTRTTLSSKALMCKCWFVLDQKSRLVSELPRCAPHPNVQESMVKEK